MPLALLLIFFLRYSTYGTVSDTVRVFMYAKGTITVSDYERELRRRQDRPES